MLRPRRRRAPLPSPFPFRPRQLPRRQASRSRGRCAPARPSAPRCPRRSGRARARTPRARPARGSRAPAPSRPWRAPDRSPTTRAVDSASGSTQSFRSCLEDRQKSLTDSRRRILRLPGETRVAPPCIPLHGTVGLGARLRVPTRTVYDAERPGKVGTSRRALAGRGLLRRGLFGGPIGRLLRRAAGPPVGQELERPVERQLLGIVAAAKARVRLAVGHIRAEAARLDEDRLAAHRVGADLLQRRRRLAAAPPLPRL